MFLNGCLSPDCSGKHFIFFVKKNKILERKVGSSFKKNKKIDNYAALRIECAANL